jgi:hypothetical protein
VRRVGHLLLKLSYTDIRLPRHFYIADDCFEISKIPARRLTQVVTKSVEKLYGSMYFLFTLPSVISIFIFCWKLTCVFPQDKS